MSKPKPFRDWGVVNFLQDKVPDALGKVGEVVADIATGGNPARAIISALSGEENLTKEEMLKAQQLMIDDLEREKLVYADLQDARTMQTDIATSDNSTWLAQNFLYLLSAFVVFCAAAFGVASLFVEIPEKNERLVYLVVDFFMLTGGAMVLNFFFGRPSTRQTGRRTFLPDRLRQNK